MIPALVLLLASALVVDVRRALDAGNPHAAESLVQTFQKQQGVTPESLEAYSWLARGALARKQYDLAAKYAAETRKQVLARTTAAKLDTDPHMPIALGAAIEVQGQVLDATEGKSSAVTYLQSELSRYRNTSIRTRIQKSLNLLSLEGKPAPKLQGVQLPASRPVLLFFWAHWCPDCKAEAAVIAQMEREFPELAIIGPTQLYGYAAGGQEASPQEEQAWIQSVRKQFYSGISRMATPVSDENFKVYGASTTPTLVLIDRTGIVRLYHPGRMTADELRPKIEALARRS